MVVGFSRKKEKGFGLHFQGLLVTSVKGLLSVKGKILGVLLLLKELSLWFTSRWLLPLKKYRFWVTSGKGIEYVCVSYSVQEMVFWVFFRKSNRLWVTLVKE